MHVDHLIKSRNELKNENVGRKCSKVNSSGTTSNYNIISKIYSTHSEGKVVVVKRVIRPLK